MVHVPVLPGAATCGHQTMWPFRSMVKMGSRSWSVVTAQQNNPYPTDTQEAFLEGGSSRCNGCSCWGQAPATPEHRLLQGAAEGERLLARVEPARLVSAAPLTALKYSSFFKSFSKHPIHTQWVKRPRVLLKELHFTFVPDLST